MELSDLKIFSVDKSKIWNEIVKSFENWDIYYLNEYSKSLEIHGDGEPLLIYYKKNFFRLCYVVMKNDIGKVKEFQDSLKLEQYYDLESPYGYGGPLFEGDYSDKAFNDFYYSLLDYCKEEKIISQFIRFMPLTQNQKYFSKHSKCVKLKQTIVVDTASEEIIMNNLTSKNRNMIRKAKKNDVSIASDNGKYLEKFIDIYEKTMNKNQAADYYYFSRDYFNYLINNLGENIIIFYAFYQEKIISSSIFFHTEKYMHYHLSGTLEEYRHQASSNLLIYEASLWAAKRGIQKLHLGAGINSEDSLFSFKKQFNRYGKIDFYIGRNIFDEEAFQALFDLRTNIDSNFKKDNSFLIKYRG